jgi:hypothetical protein
MARLEYFLVAEDVSIDQTTNRISVFNIFEEFQTGGFPLLVSKCVAVALWEKESSDEGRDFQTSLRVTAPNDQHYRVDTNFRLVNERHRIVNRIRGIPISAVGEVRFELLLNGEHKASHTIAVRLRPTSDVTGPPVEPS